MNQVWLYTIGSVLVVSLIALVGIFTLSLKKNVLNKILVFIISFAAGTLLGDAFLHLVPESLEKNPQITASLFILAGLLVFFILEKILCWRHCHIPTSQDHPHPVGTMNIVGDALHNFIDGAIIAGSFLVSIPLGMATTIAVILHEIPQEIGEFGILLHAGYSRPKALLFNFLSALTAVLGAVLVLLINTSSQNIVGFLIPFTAGGFIYIASADLIPEMHKETRPWKSLVQLSSLVLGIVLMLMFK